MPAATYWCESAYVGTPPQASMHTNVTVDVDDAGKIERVVTATAPPNDAIVLRGLVLPGLANAHSHAFHRALRARTHAGGGSFWTWRNEMYRVAQRLDPDSYYALARGVYGEMVHAGVTAVGEFHYLHHQPDGSPFDDPNATAAALVAAAADAGLRLTLLDTLYLHGGLANDGYIELAEHQQRFSDSSYGGWAQRVEQLLDRVPSPNQHWRVGAAVHSVRAVSPSDIQRVAAFALEHEMPLHVHVSEQPEENRVCHNVHGVSPVELVTKAGFGVEATLVHATHLNPAALNAVGGRFVCFCPTTERDLADGLGEASSLVQSRARLCLGTDSHAEIDLLGEARALEHNERLRCLARGVFTPDELVTFATVNGHRSLGWSDAGALAVGMRADLVAVRQSSVRTAGAPPLVASAVFAADAADVTDVVVDGVHVVRAGRHQRVNVAAELETAIGTLVD